MTQTNPARAEWFRQRIENIHSKISAFDVLRSNGVVLQLGSDDRPEQFPCPFHGVDRNPSARVYPADARSNSHAWCFVCQERWDAISLWQKFNGTEKFGAAVSQMERAYGLETPAEPEGGDVEYGGPQEPEPLAEFDALYDVCERRLWDAKPAFDMMGYLRLGSVLDRLRSRVDAKAVSSAEGLKVLQRVLDKVGEKARSCPDG